MTLATEPPDRATLEHQQVVLRRDQREWLRAQDAGISEIVRAALDDYIERMDGCDDPQI